MSLDFNHQPAHSDTPPGYVYKVKIEAERRNPFQQFQQEEPPTKIHEGKNTGNDKSTPPPAPNTVPAPVGAILKEQIDIRTAAKNAMTGFRQNAPNIGKSRTSSESSKSNKNADRGMEKSNKELRTEVLGILSTMKDYLKEKTEPEKLHQYEMRLDTIGKASPALRAFIAKKKKIISGTGTKKHKY